MTLLISIILTRDPLKESYWENRDQKYPKPLRDKFTLSALQLSHFFCHVVSIIRASKNTYGCGVFSIQGDYRGETSVATVTLDFGLYAYLGLARIGWNIAYYCRVEVDVEPTDCWTGTINSGGSGVPTCSTISKQRKYKGDAKI